MSSGKFVGFALRHSLDAALGLLEQASDADIDRFLALMEMLTKNNVTSRRQIPAVRKAWAEKQPAACLLQRAIHELRPNVLKTIINNLVINNSYGSATERRSRLMREENFRPPYTMLVSPTMRCNLRCPGCYAGEYTMRDDLPVDVLNRVLREGQEMGIFLAVLLGGEPFVYPAMWDVFATHSQVEFVPFTNGSMIGAREVDRLAQLGNVAPMISLEGFDEETDARRGAGSFERILNLMDALKSAGVLFGFSCMVTRQNVETVCSDAFNDLMVEKGAYLGWHFLYMPVGRNPNVKLMPTPRQREYMRTMGAARIRATRPLFVIDFWNDAPYVGGCIAGGRDYFHINSSGDVEPCIFTHFATDNIKNTSLRKALDSPFFQGIRARQPFDPNLLLPCQLIDHPQVFRELYEAYHPYPTHSGALSLLDELAPELDAYSSCVNELMQSAWQRDFLDRGFVFHRADEEARVVQEEKV